MILIFLSLLHLSLGSEFVRRDGSQLMLGEEEFTFSGVNIYWLGQVINKKQKYNLITQTNFYKDENNPNTPTGEQPFYSHPSNFRYNERDERKLQGRRQNIFPLGLMMFSPQHYQWVHESLGVTH